VYMDIAHLIATYAFPVLVSGAVGFYFNFAGGFSKEFFDERARKKKHKLNVAQHVLQICNEGFTMHYIESPRDIEHVNSVINNLKGIDEDVEQTIHALCTLVQQPTVFDVEETVLV
jgi:hypothetical protein